MHMHASLEHVEDKKKLLWMLMPSQPTERILTLPRQMLLILSLCCRAPFPEILEKTILSMPRSPRLLLPATVKLMEVTLLTVRPSARSSISAQLMELVVSPSTASSAPTEPSSTRTISSATGGSTSTALRPRDCTLSMTKLLLNARLTLELLLMPLAHTPAPTLLLLEDM